MPIKTIDLERGGGESNKDKYEYRAATGVLCSSKVQGCACMWLDSKRGRRSGYINTWDLSSRYVAQEPIREGCANREKVDMSDGKYSGYG